MRTFLLHAAAWASALQTVGSSSASTGDPARLLGAAGILGSITVFVYRLGVWRQEMENTKRAAIDEIARLRDDVDRRLGRLEGRDT